MESEEKAKTIEKDLLSRQADIRFMKISYQDFSNLADSFTRDLQNYYAKLKDSRRIKHLSTDFQTDLTRLKECLAETDNKFQTISTRLKLIKDIISNLLENQRQLNSNCNKFNTLLCE